MKSRIRGVGVFVALGAASVIALGCTEGSSTTTGDAQGGAGGQGGLGGEGGQAGQGGQGGAANVCGDGAIGGPEACDDGSTADGDGCSQNCLIEPGYSCMGSPSVCAPGCGDGKIIGNETCDDGNTANGDGCSSACTFEMGWTCGGLPTICVDVNECATGTDNCGTNATCINTGGSFTCACSPGYMGDGFTCSDVDECEDETHNCDANANCTNSPGSYTCACQLGFMGNGFSCADVDECALDMDDCSVNATCANSPGSFMCTCNTGFTGTGVVCMPLCGDTMIIGGEVCDDGNVTDGDGCSSMCKVEPYFRCRGTAASVCTHIKILYAPSNTDDPDYRAAIAAITGGSVDYFDGGATTPTVDEFNAYDCVHTYAIYKYLDEVAFGDNLATFVDKGGNVVLGSFATYTSGNPLGGLIMTNGYCPVTSPSGDNHLSLAGYAGNGTTFIHNEVKAYEGLYRDILVLQGTGIVDGIYVDGEIAHAYRPDFKVIYSNGSGAAGMGGSGDWPRLIANSCAVGFLQ